MDAAEFSGHSLRAGFLTSAAARGSSAFKMMDVSRHKAWKRFAVTAGMLICSEDTPAKDRSDSQMAGRTHCQRDMRVLRNPYTVRLDPSRYSYGNVMKHVIA